MTRILSRRDALISTGLLALAAPAILRASAMPAPRGQQTHDALLTFDQATKDSTGAFLISELERLDPTIHMPLLSTSWGRDIDLRTDVSMGDELSSFTVSSYAAPGGITPGGKSWIGKDSNAITGVALDIGKVGQPLHLWGMELNYTIPELDSAQRLGRPVDTQKYEAIKTKHQMDIDEMVYIGDGAYGNFGLLNSPAVTQMTAPNGKAGTSTWATKTHDEIIADVAAVLMQAWTASGWAIAPTDLRLPPAAYGIAAARKVSEAGNVTVLEYIAENNISKRVNGRALNIQPLKWATGRGVGNTDRMLAYTRNPQFVRYPMTPLNRTPVENRSIWQMTTYYCRLGVVEFVYPETLAYMDGI
jgi:hypothetical protein